MGNCQPSNCGKDNIEYDATHRKNRTVNIAEQIQNATDNIQKHPSHLAPMDSKTMQLLLQLDNSFTPTPIKNVPFIPMNITGPKIDAKNNGVFKIQITKINDSINDNILQPDTSDSECDYDSSDYSDNDRLNSNLYRAGTSNPWDLDDMEHLHNEMSCQLIDLTKQAFDVEINRLNTNKQLSQCGYIPYMD
eukprot:313264_1